MNDENRPSAEIERAKEKKRELEQEQNEIENEREREMEQLPLRDRLREKVKSIFKKYGFTVTAVCWRSALPSVLFSVALKRPERGFQRRWKRP